MNYFFISAVALSVSSDVQCAHLVAAIGISDKQYGHFFVVGAAGASGFFFRFMSLFAALSIANNTSATIRKLIIAVMKSP